MFFFNRGRRVEEDWDIGWTGWDGMDEMGIFGIFGTFYCYIGIFQGYF